MTPLCKASWITSAPRHHAIPPTLQGGHRVRPALSHRGRRLGLRMRQTVGEIGVVACRDAGHKTAGRAFPIGRPASLISSAPPRRQQYLCSFPVASAAEAQGVFHVEQGFDETRATERASSRDPCPQRSQRYRNRATLLLPRHPLNAGQGSRAALRACERGAGRE